MYPEFVHELQDESGMDVDLRDQGTIFFPSPVHLQERPTLLTDHPLPAALADLEPGLADLKRAAIYLRERSVDLGGGQSGPAQRSRRFFRDDSRGGAFLERKGERDQF
jgi:hypothetical protein